MSNDNIVQLKEKHASLYFVDGNVVILAPRIDKSGLLFRVHKSVLSSHSPIFSDMFDVCNPSDYTSEKDADHFYDGVPLVHLSDDADHLASVLGVLYYQSELPCMPRNPHYPELVTPILDLSRKYGIDRMYAQIVKHLECDWPQTLKDWDRYERDVVYIEDEGRMDDHLPEPAAAIKLAHQFDIPSILPAAFYHLSRLSILDDWDKTHADSSIYIRNSTKRTARWGQLSAKDFHCLLLGKAELADFLRGCVQPRDFRHTSRNVSKQECEVGEGLWKDVMDRCVQSADPLAILLKIPNTAYGCHTCANTVKAKAQYARTQIWEKLGDLFHIKDV